MNYPNPATISSEKRKYATLLEQLAEQPLIGSQKQLLEWWRQRIQAQEAIIELLEMVLTERKSRIAWEEHTREIKAELDKARGVKYPAPAAYKE